MGSKRTPKVIKRDPVQEQAQAERAATRAANAEIAFRRKEMRYSSFLATGGGAAGIERGKFRSALAMALPATTGTGAKLGGGG